MFPRVWLRGSAFYAIMVVAVAALGVALAAQFDTLRRAAFPHLERRGSLWRPRWFRANEPLVRRCVDDFYAFLGVSTMGAAFVLGQPAPGARPRRRGDWGALATLSGALVGATLVCKDLLWLGLAWPPPLIPVAYLLNDVHRLAGVVLGTWVAIHLAGRPRRRRAIDWRERLGRLIGWGWMTYFVYLAAWPAVWG